MIQGSPAVRANPGLNDGIPMGLLAVLRTVLAGRRERAHPWLLGTGFVFGSQQRELLAKRERTDLFAIEDSLS